MLHVHLQRDEALRDVRYRVDRLRANYGEIGCCLSVSEIASAKGPRRGLHLSTDTFRGGDGKSGFKGQF